MITRVNGVAWSSSLRSFSRLKGHALKLNLSSGASILKHALVDFGAMKLRRCPNFLNCSMRGEKFLWWRMPTNGSSKMCLTQRRDHKGRILLEAT